jgi:hypothetical protein
VNKVSKTLNLFLMMTFPVFASEIPASQLEFFETKIRPVLADSCYECHNSINKKKGKLALDWKDPLLARNTQKVF